MCPGVGGRWQNSTSWGERALKTFPNPLGHSLCAHKYTQTRTQTYTKHLSIFFKDETRVPHPPQIRSDAVSNSLALSSHQIYECLYVES